MAMPPDARCVGVHHHQVFYFSAEISRQFDLGQYYGYLIGEVL